MSIVTELELIPDSLEGPALHDAQVLLEALHEATGAELVALVECRSDLQPRGPLAWAGHESPGADRWNRLIRLVREVLHDQVEDDESPVMVGAGASIAAGSVVTRNVPSDALAIARAELELRDGWAKRFREMMAARKAARNGK